MVIAATTTALMLSLRSARALVTTRPTATTTTTFCRALARSSKQNDDDEDPTASGGASTATLEWERFEFSDRPKNDRRFYGDDDADGPSSAQTIQHADNDAFRDVVRVETALDEEFVSEFDRRRAELSSVSSSTVARATAALRAYLTDERIARLESVLDKRTDACRLLFENPANPSNVWACLRTADSFGVRTVHVVVESATYNDAKSAVFQKRGARSAMGSARWVDVVPHSSTEEAVVALRRDGYRIVASDCDPHRAIDVRDVEWVKHNDDDDDENNNNNNNKVCVVMGNEARGISESMREAADELFTLPMDGFAESFNLSVATAITCAHLSARADDGPIRPGDLEPRERDLLRLRWTVHSISKIRTARLLLEREGIVLPDAFFQ